MPKGSRPPGTPPSPGPATLRHVGTSRSRPCTPPAPAGVNGPRPRSGARRGAIHGRVRPGSSAYRSMYRRRTTAPDAVVRAAPCATAWTFRRAVVPAFTVSFVLSFALSLALSLALPFAAWCVLPLDLHGRAALPPARNRCPARRTAPLSYDVGALPPYCPGGPCPHCRLHGLLSWPLDVSPTGRASVSPYRRIAISRCCSAALRLRCSALRCSAALGCRVIALLGCCGAALLRSRAAVSPYRCA